MNNHVIFAAAGNGKTYSLCSKAKDAVSTGHKRVLLVSYTNEGIHALETEYKKQNYGVIDDRVTIKSWYSFLLSEFVKPYQCALKLKYKQYKKEFPIVLPEDYISSIAFYSDEQSPRWSNQTHVQYFLNGHSDIYPDKTSHLAFLCNKDSMGKAIARMEDIYSHIFIDELQDYAGWDLEIIKLLFLSNISIWCVGDYKQSTFRTNNSPKNRQYRNENIRTFFENMRTQGICSIEFANTTRRFNQEICAFINLIHGDKEAIVVPDASFAASTVSDNIGVYLVDIKYLGEYCSHYHPVVLRYDKNVKIEFENYNHAINYGSSKGATFDRTVIVPVSTAIPFINNQMKISSDQTRSKFYVACTRAKHSIVFAMNSPKGNNFFKSIELNCNGTIIPAFKFHPAP